MTHLVQVVVLLHKTSLYFRSICNDLIVEFPFSDEDAANRLASLMFTTLVGKRFGMLLLKISFYIRTNNKTNKIINFCTLCTCVLVCVMRDSLQHN